MQKPGKLAVVAATAVTAVGVGTGVAFAHGLAAHTVRPAVEEPAAPDTDTLQQGDQTSPDTRPDTRPDTTPDRVATVQRAAARLGVHRMASQQAAASQQSAASDHSGSAEHHRSSAQSRSDEPGENNGENENENAPEDGPGGHQDPPGDVQHEGGANEP